VCVCVGGAAAYLKTAEDDVYKCDTTVIDGLSLESTAMDCARATARESRPQWSNSKKTPR